jgi:hypothetical protein
VTKKAAFQEFGLLYVVPRSDEISVTPVGKQLLEKVPTLKEAKLNRPEVLFLLGRTLARYQFNNPSPIGGDKNWAALSDVRPYLAIYYLMVKLDGLLTQPVICTGKAFPSRLRCTPLPIQAGSVPQRPLCALTGWRLAMEAADKARPHPVPR